MKALKRPEKINSKNITPFVQAAKNRARLFICLALSLPLLLSGCVSTYMPNTPNVPMFTEQGELSASGHISLKGNISFNTAYAVTDHYAVMLNGSILDSERRKVDFRHNLIEAAGGYYTTFGPNNDRVLEIYGGFGGGSSDRTEKEEHGDGTPNYQRREADFTKYFTQVNFSSKKKRSLKLLNREYPLNYGTALRASYLNMSEHTLNGVAEPLEDNIFLEPIFYTRLTLNPSVQLQYTSGTTIGLKSRDSLKAAYSVFSVGFVINVGGSNITTR